MLIHHVIFSLQFLQLALCCNLRIQPSFYQKIYICRIIDYKIFRWRLYDIYPRFFNAPNNIHYIIKQLKILKKLFTKKRLYIYFSIMNITCSIENSLKIFVMSFFNQTTNLLDATKNRDIKSVRKLLALKNTDINCKDILI